MSKAQFSTSVGAYQSNFHGYGSNANFVSGISISIPPRTAFPMTYGSFGRVIFLVTIISHGYKDLVKVSYA